jgi:ATP-dependent Clp protease ATP-binding subunit ClpA
MNIEIPVLVEPDAQADNRPEGGSVYRVRPLFFDVPDATDRTLATALSRLAERLEKMLSDLGRDGDHRSLAAWTYSPEVELHQLELLLDLRNEVFRGHFPVVTFRQLDRTLAFSPRLDDVWFEMPQPGHPRSDQLIDHATEVYTRWFRQALKRRDEEAVRSVLARFQNKKKPWITLLEVAVTTRMTRGKPAANPFALMDGSEVGTGAEELDVVGRCLDSLYPDGLARAVCRDSLVAELQRLLHADDQRPVLLVGPSMVGKTALVHEYVWRRAARRAEMFESRVANPDENVWLLAPQRLISGMSYVGQWENRLLAILNEANKRKHILYFNDLPGLHYAGITSQSTLSVADVLKPYVERREVRMLAETTPEQLRVFRERDRSFADLFQVLQIEQPGEEETLRILINVARSLEARHGVRFALDVLPSVLELSRCWQPDAAFPGKAAVWLNRLAVKHQSAPAGRDNVLEELHATSGLQVNFVDTQARLPREEMLANLRSRIIGQAPAVEAMADVVGIAKARLNDRQRPLGTLFFLGPTGVGKTECAKALTHTLFGSADRLVRFDMNDFIAPQSVARLVGTIHQPDGLLTAAVRRQPFCVLLLDEIEKAHADVFDLLLQILGEARLTDALGRTASFANAVIILTSNLGTRQAAREMGFATSDAQVDEVYVKAVTDFFRPEFLNRLDRIVPFRQLDRAELEQIARTILADIFVREGLTRRRCAIELAGDALAWVVDRGFDRALGARAMRRAVERDLVRPIARQLAAISPDTPTVINVRRGVDALLVKVVPLVEAARRAELSRPAHIDDAKAMLACAREVLDRQQAAYVANRPPMQDASGQIAAGYHWYLAITEFLRNTRLLAASIADDLEGPRRGERAPAIHPHQPRSRWGTSRRYLEPDRRVLKEMVAANDVVEYVRELAGEGGTHDGVERDTRMRLLLDRLALTEALIPSEGGWPVESVIVLIRTTASEANEVFRGELAVYFMAKYGDMRSRWRHSSDEYELTFGLEATHWRQVRRQRSEDRVWWEEMPSPETPKYRDRYCFDLLVIEGYRAWDFMRYEAGTHLMVMADGRLEPVQVVVRRVAEGGSAWDALSTTLRCHEAAGDDDPFQWQPTVSVHGPEATVTDLQNGLTFTISKDDAHKESSLMACLPLPAEIRELLGPMD